MVWNVYPNFTDMTFHKNTFILKIQIFLFSPSALQKKPEEINVRAADMWSYAILLWELATREVPFADIPPMELGMKVS
jgi:hypothetical protein